MKVKNKCFPFGIPEKGDILLFCFHHAGGNAGQIRKWSGVRDNIAVVPVEYAGHGCRMGEKFSRGLCETARETASEILKNSSGRRIYIYGHSLGSLIAFETVKLLERKNADVHGLIVAGRGAPFDKDFGNFRSTMGREALVKEMLRLGGMNKTLLSDEDFMNYFAPIIINDYSLYEKYHYDKSTINAPIWAHCARKDVETSPEQMSHWSMTTSGSFNETVFEGGHFFVLESEKYFDTLINTVNKMERQ